MTAEVVGRPWMLHARIIGREDETNSSYRLAPRDCAVLIHVDPDSIDITSEAWPHPGPALRLYHPMQAMAA